MGIMTFEEAARIEPQLEDLFNFAAAVVRTQSEFCANELWYGCSLAQARELLDVSREELNSWIEGTGLQVVERNGLPYWEGLKEAVCRLAGSEAGNLALRSSSAYDVAYEAIYDALPDCGTECGCSGARGAL